MSKGFLLVGLIVSVAIHLTLLGIDFSAVLARQVPLRGFSSLAEVVWVGEPSQDAPSVKVSTDEAESLFTEPVQPPAEPIVERGIAPKIEEQKLPPPMPPMEMMHQQQLTNMEQSFGDFAGSPKGKPAAALRIDWGSFDHALRILDTGKMKLVILEDYNLTGASQPHIDQEFAYRKGRWVAQPLHVPVGMRFSNRLRIVHDVPAFSQALQSPALDRDDRLAVMLPTQVERMLETAQLTAASARGLHMVDVRNFGGRFELTNDRLSFNVIHVQPRSGLP